MLPDRPEYEPTIPVVCSEISILKTNNTKEIIPTANNNDNPANEIINSLSSFLFIIEHLQFAIHSLHAIEYKIRCPFFRTESKTRLSFTHYNFIRNKTFDGIYLCFNYL